MTGEGETGIHCTPERLVIKYLQDNKDGATIAQIIRHLRSTNIKKSYELTHMVECILENATALGFLEQKGLRDLNWKAKRLCDRQGRCCNYYRRRHRRGIRHCRRRQ